MKGTSTMQTFREQLDLCTALANEADVKRESASAEIARSHFSRAADALRDALASAPTGYSPFAIALLSENLSVLLYKAHRYEEAAAQAAVAKPRLLDAGISIHQLQQILEATEGGHP